MKFDFGEKGIFCEGIDPPSRGIAELFRKRRGTRNADSAKHPAAENAEPFRKNAEPFRKNAEWSRNAEKLSRLGLLLATLG